MKKVIELFKTFDNVDASPSLSLGWAKPLFINAGFRFEESVLAEGVNVKVFLGKFLIFDETRDTFDEAMRVGMKSFRDTCKKGGTNVSWFLTLLNTNV